MARHLATIQRISGIADIEGKDRIGLATVLGWKVIVQKSDYKVGDLCIYVEPDSLLPEKPEFEFLRSKNFRIKVMKMAGVVSYGICFPISILPPNISVEEGLDVTEILNITKYEAPTDDGLRETRKAKQPKNPIVKYMMKYGWFRNIYNRISIKDKKCEFPSFISKTDEERIQNIPDMLNVDCLWTGTEKIDGQSGTFFLKRTTKGILKRKTLEFGVCSRNLRLPKPKEIDITSSYWFVAQKYDIEQVLTQILNTIGKEWEWVAIQGECIAPKVQGNKYKVTEPDLYVFNFVTPDGKWSSLSGKALLEKYGLKWVPILYTDFAMPNTVDELLNIADGESALLEGQIREGIVWRNSEKNLSFKSVSPKFLLKYD